MTPRQRRRTSHSGGHQAQHPRCSGVCEHRPCLAEGLEQRMMLASFLATPPEIAQGSMLPVVIGFSDAPGYAPTLSYATVKVGFEASDSAVTLYDEAGAIPLGSGGDSSISFLDPKGNPFCPDFSGTQCWYTVGYIRPKDYLPSVQNGVVEVGIEVSGTYVLPSVGVLPWNPSREILTKVLPSLPHWDGWYAGDTHLHSYLTNLQFWLDIEAEAGAPLRLSRLLGQASGLDWAVVTDHSYALDDVEEWPLEAWTGNRDYYMNPHNVWATPVAYPWEDLESDPAWQSPPSQPLIFFKGEELSVNAPDRGDGIDDTLAAQFHLLANGFDENDAYIEAPGWGAFAKRDPDELLPEMVARSDGQQPVFGYYAHPKADDWKYAEPMTLEDVEQSRNYFDAYGRRIVRGFEFWNGRTDAKRDASLDLWEEYLAAHPEEHDWFLAGGSDEHLSDGPSIGNVRIVVLSPARSAADILEGYRLGRSIVTDGPLIAMGIDRNGDGDVSDFPAGAFAGDGLLGQSITCTSPADGILTFDWPDQTGMPWPAPQTTNGRIHLIHYNDRGQYLGWTDILSKTFDAYSDWRNQIAEYGIGWQCYRLEYRDQLTGYLAFTNPIWLNFAVPEPPRVETLALSKTTIDEGEQVRLTVDFSDVNWSVNELHTVRINWGDGAVTTSEPTEWYRYQAYHGYLDDEPAGTAADKYTIAVTVSDGAATSAAKTADLTVRNVAPMLSLNQSVAGTQYSDQLEPITITAKDVPGDELVAVASGLPAGVALTRVGKLDRWQLSGTVTAGPGTYKSHVQVSDDDGGTTTMDVIITVTPENAEVMYDGPQSVPLALGSSSAAVNLSASLSDWSVVAPLIDDKPGLIRNAMATFRVYDVLAMKLVAEFLDVPVTPSRSNPGMGTAHCTWTANIGASLSRDYRIVVEAGGYYTHPPLESLITVGRPSDRVVTGNGTGETFYVRRLDDEVLVYGGLCTPALRDRLQLIDQLVIDSLDGDDRLIIDLSGGDPIPPGGLLWHAGAGNDTLTIVGRDSKDELTVEAARVLVGSSAISASDAEGVILDAIPAGPDDSPSVVLGKLAIADKGRATTLRGGNRILRVAGLAILGTGTLDLADNDMMIQTADPAARRQMLDYVSGLIQRARTLNASGILTSSAGSLTGLAAIANADAAGAAIFSPTWGGQPADANRVLIKYTFNGDADLNGMLDGSDYFFIDKGFLSRNSANPPTGYRNGDFNYDGTIDGSDYFLIDKAYLATHARSDAPTSVAAPETAADGPRNCATAANRLLCPKFLRTKRRRLRHL